MLMKKLSKSAIVEHHIRSWADLPVASHNSSLVPTLRLIADDLSVKVPEVLPHIAAPFNRAVLMAWNSLMHQAYRTALDKMDRAAYEETIINAVRQDTRLLRAWVAHVEYAAEAGKTIKKEEADQLLTAVITELLPEQAAGILESSRALGSPLADAVTVATNGVKPQAAPMVVAPIAEHAPG